MTLVKFRLATLVCCILSAFPSPSREAKGRSLPPHHAKAGVHCFDCHHEENPTNKPVAAAICMNCHGDYPAMKEYTKNVKPNPHDLHLGESPCMDCHRQHQPPVVTCLKCHEGKYKFNIR